MNGVILHAFHAVHPVGLQGIQFKVNTMSRLIRSSLVAGFHLLLIIHSMILLLCSPDVFGQDNSSPSPDWKLSGFVKNSYWLDTRQIDGGREDLMLYYPLKPAYDRNGNDINAHASSNFNALATRLTFSFQGPKAFGAISTALIEGDFTGTVNADVNGFRLRHAWGKLQWQKSSLMFGQYWHPMFVPEVFPELVSLNTGAPFQPFIRNPLLSYKYFIGKFTFEAAMIAQRDNSSDGPKGHTGRYMRQAVIPNLHGQLQYKTQGHVVGAAIDHKYLKPRLATDSLLITNEILSSTSGMLYYKYTHQKLIIRSKLIVGQNLTEHLMLGGYAVRSVDPASHHETYTPTNHLFMWSGITYGKYTQFGLFGGFAKNLGTTHPNTGKYYARGQDIDYMYRITPTCSVQSGRVKLAGELEYTVAAFGAPDIQGKVENAEEVANLRVLLAFFYLF